MSVARLLAPPPWGEDLSLDEFNQWKALQFVRVEEQDRGDDGRPSAQPEKKKVVTDDAEIARWFATS
jgi:hypothetical protein